MYALGRAMALASGKQIMGETVHHRVNSWVMNLEDPLEEIERRVASMMLRHRLTREDLDGRLYLNSGRDRRLMIAQPSEYGDIIYPDKSACIDAMLAASIGHIVIDPFVKSHGLEENSNPHMDAAATAWAEIGHATGAAIDLIHHTRKGTVVDVDAARGGKALTDASRVAQTMSSMLPEEAEKLGVKDVDRWRYVRLDDAKANMAPKTSGARWFVLERVNLGNSTDSYPNGDNVAAIAPWEPPTPFEGLTWPMISALLGRLEAGPEEGEMYATTKRGRSNDRWAGHVFDGISDKTDGQRQEIINRWLREEVIYEAEYRSPKTRKNAMGIVVNTQKVLEMKRDLEGF